MKDKPKSLAFMKLFTNEIHTYSCLGQTREAIGTLYVH